MSNMLDPLSALLAGIILGGIFFGGLWWTIRRAMASESPALWFLGSLMARTAILLAGLYLTTRGDWHRLVLTLIGIIGSRWMLLRLTRTRPALAP